MALACTGIARRQPLTLCPLRLKLLRTSPHIQSPGTLPAAPALPSSAGLPLGRTGGLRTKGLVDKLVSTMAAVTLSMSSSSDDFLKHSEWGAGNTLANI